MRKILILLTITLALGVTSCKDENEDPKQAVRLTIDQMQKLPGYVWIKEGVETYEPDTTIIRGLKSLPQNEFKIYAFIPGDCDCSTNKKHFSALAKTLADIGFPDSLTEYYSMQDRREAHPYLSKVAISFLPAIFVFKNGTPIYSVVDTINLNTDKKIGYPVKVEECLYEAMK